MSRPKLFSSTVINFLSSLLLNSPIKFNPNKNTITRAFSENNFEEEFQRACSGVCEIVPQVKGPKRCMISIFVEKPAPTLSLREIATTFKIKENIICHCGPCVGPGASKKGIYKNPEYFCYHKMSYYEAMNNLHCFRLPQPSNKPPDFEHCKICTQKNEPQ